jgi:hypothetical protein
VEEGSGLPDSDEAPDEANWGGDSHLRNDGLLA